MIEYLLTLILFVALLVLYFVLRYFKNMFTNKESNKSNVVTATKTKNKYVVSLVYQKKHTGRIDYKQRTGIVESDNEERAFRDFVFDCSKECEGFELLLHTIIELD